MKKITFRDKIQYKFDNLMSRGTIALVGMLFLVTTTVVLTIGLVAFILGQGESIAGNVWLSIMHTIDAGTITAADTSNVEGLVLMSIVTLCGIFITSILIGIITSGFEERLNSLKKGNSKVIEKNHTIILGFNDSIFTLISELTIANENKKNACIVILADADKETMEMAVAKQVVDLKTTRVICRTGNIADPYMLERCSLETCRSIIINEQKDCIVIKAILAINTYLKGQENSGHTAHITATVNEVSNFAVAQIAGEGNVELLLSHDVISRIIAHSCRQTGFSNVLVELFDYDGDELYFESIPELTGKTFGDTLNYFEKAIVFGYKRDTQVYLNPKKDHIMENEDKFILLVEDDGCAKPRKELPELKDFSSIKVIPSDESKPENILILGINDMLKKILLELDHYLVKNSKVIIANETIDKSYTDFISQLKNIYVELVACDTSDRASLNNLTKQNIEQVLLLSDYGCDAETSDAMALLKLIHLRDIAQKEGKAFNITSEMQSVANQKLAKVAEVNDLIVGTNILNLLLTQISENRDLAIVFKELLEKNGSEIYMKKASDYMKLDHEVDFYTITEIVKERDEIAIGYKKQIGKTFEIMLNPLKSQLITLDKEDCIIVLASE